MSILELPDEILYHLLTVRHTLTLCSHFAGLSGRPRAFNDNQPTDQTITSLLVLLLPSVPLMQYVEDTDFPNIAQSCKKLRNLTMDGPLRRHILLIRNPARLSVSLQSRPNRDTLVHQNILRGIHIRQHIQQGQYIGGASSVRSYHISCRLERQMVSIRIAKKLKARPDWTEMVERGLIPEEMFFGREEFEMKRRWKLYQQQQRNQRLQLQQRDEEVEEEEQEEEEEKYSYNRRLPDLQQSGPMQVDGVHPFDIDDSNTDRQFHQPTQESNSNSTTISPSPLPSLEGPTIHRKQRQKKSISNVLIPKLERLRKAMDRDRLSRLVQRRPSPSELNQSPKTATVLHTYHLIAYASTSKELVPLTAQLSFLLKGERLGHWLYHQRPSLAVVMNERHMLRTEVRTAWMVCPGVSKKVRFYEGLIQERRHYEQQLQDFFFQHQEQQQQRQRQQQQQEQLAHPQQQQQQELLPLAVS